MVLSYSISSLVVYLFRNFTPSNVDRIFRRLQLLSSSTLSLGHGGNDAQKSMGIIWAALIVSGLATKNDPIALWIILSCQTAIALGTLFGGWRIVKTMGQKITKVKPFRRILFRNSRSPYIIRCNSFWDSCKYNSYNHRCHNRCRCKKGCNSCKMGCHCKNILGMDTYNTCECLHRRTHVFLL